MLSNKDIIKELGKNIAIYPFNKSNIKGASINLTASNMAWSVDTKKTIVSNIRLLLLYLLRIQDLLKLTKCLEYR